ncbi:hydroxyphenylacetyl-CoA thioesterase PaaI [Deinococcus radiodurans R1 = ATCC 13939 = DSM 20539]|uniref:Putative esterase DR_2321 n=2 Tax=Deinococcus radiodurans TaxID=1299 RepID=Y2321_DEIRA|nr:RecName: Full=Putative esterase DR_2321 [Deinococcus radiodurans R1 = ATCC 13939 = DSM 20539]AAF11862.1 phenylacetic acid degradation protein PaaI, putative [Deinococcus radiodurans R1 = ATCC 13939 = DSM 20539]QEM71701.1 hydroxyphenylacetyl-CoA thioesterase PaaI [Deinococcus radiodurans]UDL01343.1 hydroxyphenylacetyl-CoA thioesterase PaaI [Deinococcus radiodurans R1 = ATCC 13939 = DSM 20539]HCE65018.1 hydroxyphenylacetyl-CoA thioesterase PaaI [Deinococcus radiodurans]
MPIALAGGGFFRVSAPPARTPYPEAMSYAEVLGMTILDASPDLTRVALTVTEAGLNMHGTAHGGLIFSLADEAFAVISNLDAQAVAAETHMSFFRAAREGERLVAVATPERVGRTLATYRIEVRRGEEGEVLALFLGTVSRREKQS